MTKKQKDIQKKVILKSKLYALIQQCEELIDENILECGDTSEESQKICLINALYEFEKNVNGIEEGDMK